MDEILHASGIPALSGGEAGEQKKQSASARFFAAVQAASVVLRRQGDRVFHRVVSSVAGRPLLDPLPFLAVTAAIGVGSVISTVYTPAYAVSVNGVMLGTVKEPVIFERIVDQVETRASNILGHDYVLDGNIDYSFALVRKDEVSSLSSLENYLLDQVDEVTKSYVLTVDGTPVGAADDPASLNTLLDNFKAPYVNQNTIDSGFTSNVHIDYGYTASDTLRDTQQIANALKQSVSGQTTYEVAKGDTFMAIAFANHMSISELKELNPDVNVDKLSIGQLLNVKESVPLLSVRTVDEVTYTEAIPCPVKEVDDPSMFQGVTKVVSAGVPGQAQIQADVTYVNGTEQERDVLSTTVLTEATTRVIAVGTKERPSWYPSGTFIWPSSGHVTSPFGYRTIFGAYTFHSGIDIASSYGTAIRASDGGTVVFTGWKGTYGKLVIVDHGNGYQTYYAHCSSILVSAGSKVYQGQTIARMGATGRATGTHLHFEVRANGTPVNPRSYLS